MVRKPVLEALELNLPPLAAQRRVVDTYRLGLEEEDLLRKLQQARSLLWRAVREKLAAGTMREMHNE